MSSDAVRVSTVVAADPATTFELFTVELDLWWRKGPRYRPHVRGDGVMRLEPGVGGRLLEDYGSGDPHELGRVRLWEPPKRLVLQWRNRSFAPEEETEVEIRFEAHAEGTLVELEHRGWDSLREDHPTRHGLGTGPAFTHSIGLWWGELLIEARALARKRR